MLKKIGFYTFATIGLILFNLFVGAAESGSPIAYVLIPVLGLFIYIINKFHLEDF